MKTKHTIIAICLLLLGAIAVQAQDLKSFEENGKYGFKDESGNVVIKPIYELTSYFKENFAAVKLKGKWGFIDKKGNEAISRIYDYADDFSESLAVVSINGKYGYIDTTGKVIIPLIYYGGLRFWEGRGLVCSDKNPFNEKIGYANYFYINTKGECVEDCENAPADHPRAVK